MLNTFTDKTKNQEERRQDRERQMAIMDSVATDLNEGGTSPMGMPGRAGDDNASHASKASSRGSKDEEKAPLSAGGGGGSSLYSPNAPPRGAIENARRFLWDEDEAAEAGIGLSVGSSETVSLTTRNIDWTPGSSAAATTSAPSGLGATASMPSSSSRTAGDAVGSLFGSKRLVSPSGGSGSGGSQYAGSHTAGAMPHYSTSTNLAPAGKDGPHFPRPHERTGNNLLKGISNTLAGVGSGVRSGADSVRNSIQQSIASRGRNNMEEVDFRPNRVPRRPSGDALDLVQSIERSHRQSHFDRTRNAATDFFAGCGATCGAFAVWRKAGLILVALAAIIAGMVLLITSKGSSNAPRAPAAAGTSNTGASVASVAHVEDAARFGAVRSRVLESGVSDPDLLDKSGTPQYQALKWISDWDGAKLDPQDEFLVQRYALAVFFFSTYVAAEVMDETGAEQYYEPNVVPGKGWKDSTHWMTARGYCSWAGVKCHHRHGTDILDTVYDGNNGVTHLNLTDNNVRGTISEEIRAFVDLRVLDLGQNGMTGVIPERIGELTQLVTLYLGDNDLTGTIPVSIGKLTAVTHLYLDRNLLEGNIPAEIGDMESMHMMGLHENYLMGPLPDLSKMTKLRALYLDDNDLTGPIPSTIGNLLSLEDLRLGTNNFTGTLPPELSKLEVLSTAYLEYNALTGNIPWQIYNLKELDELHLYENYFSGSLPYQLGELRDLEILYLDNNGFTGTIPATIGDCDDLTELFLHNNKLVGPIPAQIVHLKDLTHLRLDGNQLTGELPQNIDQLFKLERVYLNNNKFSGPVPDKMATLKYLEVVRLHGNDLTGKVPEGVCALREDHDLKELQADCGGTAPDVVCECCTECFE